MVDEKHGNTRFTDTYFIETVNEQQPVSTGDVADSVGCTVRTAENRLKQLRDDGRVTGDLIGGSLVWTLVEGDGE